MASVAAVLMLGALAWRLTPNAGRRRRTVLVLAIVALAATDPIMLRYGRLAIIEPFAVLGCLTALYLAIALWKGPATRYIPVVGLATGLTLLTKEVTLFLLLTPAVYALLAHDWRRLARAAGGLLAGLGLWLLFPLWAVQLGLMSSFLDVKLVSFRRLVGLVQISGWNRPDVSFLSGVGQQAGQYGSSYVVLAAGAMALLWLLLHRVPEPARWLLAWLATSYAFGAYTVLLGTLNEQFFVLVVPAALVGTVLVADAVVAHRIGVRTTRAMRTRKTPSASGRVARRVSARTARRFAAVTMLATAAVLAYAAISWARFYVPHNDGLFRSAAFIRAHMPPCTAVNGSGDPEKFAYLLPEYTVTNYATGPGAMSHGIHLFFLSDKDAALRYGNATPELATWVRTHGTRLAAFPSTTYRGVELWRVPGERHDPLTDVEPVTGGSFVTTEGSRCGGFTVLDGVSGNFATGWAALGGKAVAGPPLSASWTAGERSYQVFDGAVLVAGGDRATSTFPIVGALAVAVPDAYRKAHLPPVTQSPTTRPSPDGAVLAALTDPAIAAAYLGSPAPGTSAGLRRARALLGDPLGPPTRMPDGYVRQPFAGAVLEHSADSAEVRMAPLGRMALDAHLLLPTTRAATPAVPPRLTVGSSPPQPTTVKPFVRSLGVAVAVYAAFAVLSMFARRRRREPAGVFEMAA
jgi:hypothetical protein